ncbi:MAG: S8 family serine peptidase [Micrococcales bacterium]
MSFSKRVRGAQWFAAALAVTALVATAPQLTVFPTASQAPQAAGQKLTSASLSHAYSNIDASLLSGSAARIHQTVITTANPHTVAAKLGGSTRLTHLGGQQYVAALSTAQIASLRGQEGVRVDAVHQISVAPLSATPSAVNPAFSAQPIQDKSIITTVPATDPALLGTEQSLAATGAGSVVAVIDTGIDTNAPGLSGQVVKRVDFSSVANGCTDNGFLDPIGHGTHIASIIAGKPLTNPADPKAVGMQGIAPDAKLVDLRVFNCAASGTDTQVMQALNWVLANKATYNINVVNLSMGITTGVKDGTDALSVLVNQVTAAGVFVAVAAGNTGDAPTSINSPGTAKYAVTVGSSTTSKYGSFLSPFSSVGPTSDGRDGIDLIAPGAGIRAALTTARSSGGAMTTVYSGTSMATPYVAGVAAIVAQQHPGEAPAGTTCTVSVSCPDGVVDASMTNPIQARFKTADLLAAGSDPETGLGLISASATLKGVTADAASQLTANLTAAGSNTIVVPAHTFPASIQIQLPVAVRASIAENGDLHVALSDYRYNTSPGQTPCTYTSETGCIWNSGSFSPHSYTLYLPPTRTQQYLTVTTPKDLLFNASVVPGVGPLTMLGESVSATSRVSGTTTVTVTRTAFSATATTLAISGTSGVNSTPDQVLPAGAAGTTLSFSVGLTPGKASSERVILTGSDSAVLAVGVQTRNSGDGRLAFPNQFGFDDMYAGGNNLNVANNGGLFLQSRATGVANSQGFDQLATADPDSLTVSKYSVNQTSQTEIDLVGISDDGSTLIGMEYPSGTGLIPADAVPNGMYHFFARRVSNGSTAQVGPLDTQFSSTANEQASGTVIAANNDGSAVAWGAKLAGASSATTIAVQTGTNYATTTVLGSVPNGAKINTIQFHGNTVLAQFTTATNQTEYLSFNLAANPVTAVVFQPTATTSSIFGQSQNGLAIATFDTASPDLYCSLGGSVTKFNALVGLPPLTGQNILSVSNDCTSALVEMQNDGAAGVLTNYLIQLHADGSYQVVNAAAYTHWYANSAGTSIVTASLLQMEPGDVNGEVDYYRGAYGSQSSLATNLAVQVAGTASYGQTLIASVPNVSRSAAISYLWYRNNVPVPGTFGGTYKVGSLDTAASIRVLASISLGGYFKTLVMSSPLQERSINQTLSPTPTIAGSPLVGVQVTAQPGTWDPGMSFSYQWLRNGTAITGATSQTYLLAPADLSAQVSVSVTGSSPGYYPQTKTSGTVTVGAGNLTLTPVPNVTGTFAVGRVLTLDAGTWDDGTVLRYQWLRNGTAIAGETKGTYETVPTDKGATIQVTVTATKIGYQTVTTTSVGGVIAEGTMVLTPAPVISGTPRFGQVLSASPGTWDAGVKLSYQWLRDGQPISGATFSRYTLVGSDIGHQVAVSTYGTLNAYQSVTTYGSPVNVLPGLLVSTPDPSISGTLTIGSKLSVVTGDWDAGVTLTFQWRRDGQQIAGATGQDYTTTAEDVGHSISVDVTGSLANFETVTVVSASRVIVAGVLNISLKLVGKAAVGKTIKVALTGVPKGATVKTQWLLGGKPIAKAVKASYKPTAKQRKKKLSVRVMVTSAGMQVAVLYSKALKIK